MTSRALALAALTVTLLAGCAAAQLPPLLEDGFTPIRQGDPEALAYTAPFVADADHDPDVPAPEAILGQPVGSRLARHHEIVAACEAIAAASDRVVLRDHGRTWEGRRLLHALITSPANHARLDEISDGIQRLSDPRGLADGDADALLDGLPAVAFLGYSIHGDETSGADASLAVLHHLAADRGEHTARLLDELVIVLDPCLNPDGRERILALVEQGAGATPVLDVDAAQRGRWPWGRGNHYLFDMNRDWMTGTQPETRGRWRTIASLPPQLFVDIHEMGALDTFLFYPQNDPHNPHLPAQLDRWHGTFAADQSAAFDARGWPYYTREWADAWAPFYSDAWGSLGGAIGILYEQARTSGFPLRNASGRVNTYREAVHRQVTGSLANLGTLAANRREVLGDYLAHKRANVSADGELAGRAFVLVPGRSPHREQDLARLLVDQGLEVLRTRDHVEVRAAAGALGERADSLDLPPGSLIVPARQPLAPRAVNVLAFDVPMDEAALVRERESLEREGRSLMYDVTAWSLPLLYDVDGHWVDLPDGELPVERVGSVPAAAGGLVDDGGEGAPFGWVVDGLGDRSVAFAARALHDELVVHLAEKDFSTGGRRFARGSLLVRRDDQSVHDAAERVDRAARDAGVRAYATRSGRSPDDGPDLGGGHFLLLQRPRVGLINNAPTASDVFGHLWHHLDQNVGVPVAHLDAQAFDWVDLRRYDVLVLPPGLGGWLGDHGDALADWVRAGGTLVAVGNSAVSVAGRDDLGGVVRRRDVLSELDAWSVAAARERAARQVSVDAQALYADGPGPAVGRPSDTSSSSDDNPSTSSDEAADEAGAAVADGPETDAQGSDSSEDDDALVDPAAERQDAWARRFAPSGALLRGLVDTKHWITAGFDAEAAVLLSGSGVLLSRAPTRTPVRLAPADDLRLSGLLWPEARERLGDSAWLTVDSVGAGQVILFAGVPAFRGQAASGARLLANAVIYGKGCGTNTPVDW